MKALIIDDEQHCIDALSILIKKYCPQVTVTDTCLSGECGLKSIHIHQPELIFLDIAMPKMNGFDLLSMLEEVNFEIIFTTAYDNYAIKAFKVSAADYLLKPIDRTELVQAVKTVEERIKMKKNSQAIHSNTEYLNVLLENLQQGNNHFAKIALPTNNGLEILNEQDILYLIGDSNYVHLHLRGGKKLLVSKTIKYVEERLHAHYFFRIHHSFLVNIHEIVRYNKGDGGSVVMSDGRELCVSKNKKAELMTILRA
ncbi:MAG: LytTR family DNA-binding domain-containing protein [Bacteroidales bacterium]|nr:LytTR family DNA-binding domain-containing protein [Bacteroidales bacterium]